MGSSVCLVSVLWHVPIMWVELWPNSTGPLWQQNSSCAPLSCALGLASTQQAETPCTFLDTMLEQVWWQRACSWAVWGVDQEDAGQFRVGRWCLTAAVSTGTSPLSPPPEVSSDSWQLKSWHRSKEFCWWPDGVRRSKVQLLFTYFFWPCVPSPP